MIFWISFGAFGVVCIPFIILSLISGINLRDKLCGAIAILLFWFLCAGGMTFDLNRMNKADNWNDGYCECSTHWELRGVAKSRGGIETKYYACPNCHAEIKK